MFKVTYLSDGEGYRREVERFLDQWHSDAACITAHTSGSTGKPKEINLPKGDMMVSARATNLRFGIGAGSRLLCPLSASYIAGKMMVVRAIEADCEVAFCEPSNRFWERKEVIGFLDEGVTDLMAVVPSQVNSLLALESLPSVISRLCRTGNIIIGGAPLPKATEERLTAIMPSGIGLYATYGMTETCSHVALRKLGSDLFTPMPGISFSADHRGCLRISAPQYSFGNLQTNDVAQLSATGGFVWCGRFDNVINSGGIKIFPEELERKMEGHLPCRFYFKGVPDEKWGETVALVVEDIPDASPLPDEWIAAVCRRHLTPVETPRHILHLEEFKLTSNGKLKRI